MKVKNWDKYQHFKNKEDMKWFKLYGRDLLNDPEFMMMDDNLQATLIKIWCLASESNGKLPQVHEIAFRLRKPIEFIEKMLIELNTWIINDENYIEPIYKLYDTCIGDKIREDKIIKNNVFFEKFWCCYPSSPRKVNKSGCLKKWHAKDLDLIAEKIINHVNIIKFTEQWTKNKGEFIPMPMTYLNQERWDSSDVQVRKAWDNAL